MGKLKDDIKTVWFWLELLATVLFIGLVFAIISGLL